MAAGFVGESFLNSLLDLLFNELISPVVVNLIHRKKLNRKLVERLETTLYAAQALLIDAEKRQIKEKAVKDWLESLKDAVYEADDLLDEVSTKAATQKDPGNLLSRFLNSQEREMVSRMEEITVRIESIVRQKDILGLKEIPKENSSWRITSSLVEISDIYGRDKDKEAIIRLLLDDASDGKISVVPIVGMGGIGKTTLAQLVYHDTQVKQNFDFRAWVCVSEEFDVVKVTKTIVEVMTSASCTINDLNILQHDLEERLSRRKFLVVFDDAWSESYDDWNKLLKPFQNGIKGSKILMTTRSRKVASVVQTVPPHELSLLSHEDCWLVFAKHALFSVKPKQNHALEKIGRGIVIKCNGLPLAAQTLGGLLRGNHDVGDWNNILKSEIWDFSEDKSKIIPALRISYYYLPSYLKECFVFCSLYPKDYQFDKQELILLWMAENFLHPMVGKTLEEVGHEYFHELFSRSFFQAYRYDSNVFVMHDMMHDLAISYAGKFYFGAAELGNAASAAELDIKTRHLSHNAKGNYPISELLGNCDRLKHTRTFLEINLDKWVPFKMENAPCILLSQLKCLRVLSFNSFPIDSLPDSIGELIHLRYLDLSHSKIVTLPESMSNLYNLQTLKLRGCRRLKMLPNGMQDLINLRHVDIITTSLKEMPKGMSKLKHLQLLSDFIVGQHEENNITELGALANLRGSIEIQKLENVIDSDQASKARVGDKKLLNNLFLRWSFLSKGDIADSQKERDILHELRPHADLKQLKIWGYRGTIFPNWLGNSSYSNMAELELFECWNCRMLPSLGQLPSLKHLKISYFKRLEIVGAEFYRNDESCLETPFPSLETLYFESMPLWEKWNSVEFDAFPQLKELTIRRCPVLTGDFPSQLLALESLVIDGCNQLNSFLPRAPAIHSLRIHGANRVRMGEPPLSIPHLEIEGSHLVEPLLEVITHNQLTCLQSLHIKDCSSVISFPVACLPALLKSLRIENCRKLEFQLQQQHDSLQSLCMNECDSLTSFSLDAFPNLKTLLIVSCENMKSLVASQPLQRLHSVTINNCPNLVSLSIVGMLAPQLESLGIEGCPEIDPPKGDTQLNLRRLCISHKQMSFLSWMSLHSHCLTHLRIYGEGGCDKVMSFPKEALLPASLESLELWDIQSLETLDCRGLVHLTSLQKLSIKSCPKLEKFVGERFPASLVRLFIHRSALLAKLCKMKDPLIWPKISHIRGIKVDGTWIW